MRFILRKNLFVNYAENGDISRRHVAKKTFSRASAVAVDGVNDNSDLEGVIDLALVRAPNCLNMAVANGLIDKKTIKFLLDSGVSENFIDKDLVKPLNVDLQGSTTDGMLASTDLTVKPNRNVTSSIQLFGRSYTDLVFEVLENACAEFIQTQFYKETRNCHFQFWKSRRDLGSFK